MIKKTSYRHKRTVVDKLSCHAVLIVAVGLILTGTVILGFAAKAEHINGILFNCNRYDRCINGITSDSLA